MTYSVAIPALNAADTIVETPRSVLSQTLPPDEIVVVDDGSGDDTGAIAAGVADRVRVLRQQTAGPGHAGSRAIRETRTPIVAMFDADGLWLPHKTEPRLQALAAAPDQSLIFARHRLFPHGSDDLASGPERPGMTRSDLVFGRHVFDEVGDIVDPPGRRGEMIDWLARTRERGCRFEPLDDVLGLRRIRPGSPSYGRDAAKDRGYLAVAYRALTRQRDREGRDEQR